MSFPTELKHFCIYEYFLNGYFFKWEQMNECYLPTEGEIREVNKDGQSVTAKVTGMEKISESEYRVLLETI